ncbi:MAG: hypothetical protein EAZ55_05775 [Cytophagales bacterium]|nr:MAG: hypothetical protein EAZ55_05775 [Cytophagales bacterium]
MENIDYKTAIQAELQYLPEQYLAHLYQIIQFMALPFKEKECLNEAHLQIYADKFRKGFSLVMKKGMGLDFSYQIQEKFTVLKLSVTSLDKQQNEIKAEIFDLDKICEEKQVKIIYNADKQKYELQNLVEIEEDIEDEYSEKIIIPDSETASLYFIDVSQIDKWQPDNASDDGRNLFAFMLRVGDMYQKTKQGETI